LTQELGITHLTEFTGYLPANLVAHQLRKSKVFVLPSLTESLPSAMLEAMACKVATIVSDSWISFLPDFQNRTNTISCNGSPAGISSAIDSLLTDEDLRQRIIDSAFHTVQVRYSIDYSRKKFWKVVVQLLSSSS
jgi:glycosyltransferase involved in cell wall biosynthesis